MNNLKVIIFLTALFTGSLFSQSLVLDVSYTRWENDLNKTYRAESYSLAGSTLAYSLEYAGKTMPGERDETKSCEISSMNYDRILKAINDYKMTRDEYIYRRERAQEENVFYLKLSVNMVMDGKPTSILLEGESNLVMDNDVYLDVIGFIKVLRSIKSDC